MKSFLVGAAIATMLSACSSGAQNQVENDAGTAKDAGMQMDGAALCAFVPGPAPDISVTMTDLNYDGAVVVMSANNGAAVLASVPDSMPLGASLDGRLQSVPAGTTLWASLHQHTFKGNPFALPTTTNSWTLRKSEGGTVLAGGIGDFVSDALTDRSFLGVPITFAKICSRDEINNIVTGASCETTSYYGATIHGDSDVTLTPGSQARVVVSGIEYQVWLESSYSVVLTMPGCIGDWEPPAGLMLVGRALHLDDVLM